MRWCAAAFVIGGRHLAASSASESDGCFRRSRAISSSRRGSLSTSSSRIAASCSRAACTVRLTFASSGTGPEGLITVGAMQIDNAARRVRIGDEEIPLTMTEFNLIAVLAANPERVLTRAQLRDKVWGYPHDLDDHSVDPHVQRLRRKLSRHPESGVVLDAVPGLGYRLAVRSV